MVYRLRVLLSCSCCNLITIIRSRLKAAWADLILVLFGTLLVVVVVRPGWLVIILKIVCLH